MNDKTDTTILLDIYERLGGIEEQLKAASDHETRIRALERFEGRVGAYIWLGGSIASGVLFLLWEGLKYGADKFLHN